MIKAISTHIDSVLSGTGYIAKYFPLVEIKSNGEQSGPQFYIGKGQYSPIPSNFDNFNGMAYLRQSGNPSSFEGENPNVACGIQLSVSYPLRFVFCIPRNKLPIDNPFAADMLINDLIRLITGKDGTLKRNLKAVRATFLPDSWTTNSIDVLSEEYQGLKSVDVNYEFIYGAINLVAQVQINKDCIPEMCEEVDCA